MSHLRAIFEKIWSDQQVRCPSHQVWWHEGEHTEGEVISSLDHPEGPGLFWSKGKRYPKPKPPREWRMP
jgi:hypothetical protein